MALKRRNLARNFRDDMFWVEAFLSTEGWKGFPSASDVACEEKDYFQDAGDGRMGREKLLEL